MTPLRSGTTVWQGTTITGYTQGTTASTRTVSTGFTTLWDTNSAPNDNASQLVPIGFPFQFYGNWYGEVYVSTNGYITFTNASTTDGNNTALPTAAAPNNLIAVLWDDLIVQPAQGTADRISYTTTGTAPNRSFIVDYNSVSRVGQTTSYVYGQIVLYEGTNVIELLYDGINPVGWVGMSVTQGIENSTGTAGVQIAGSPNIAAIPTSNYSFTPTTTTSSTDDGGSAALPLGFTFNFFGNPYTQIYACTNGYVSFSNADITDFSNDPIPSTITPNDYIGLFWDDLYMDSTGLFSTLVWYNTTGTAPNRVFTIEYYGSRHIGSTASAYTGQVVLYEGSDRIECHYPTAAGLNQWYATGSATIGIEDSTGTNGVPLAGSPNLNTPPTTNLRWDPQPTTFVPAAVSCGAVGAPVTVATGQSFTVTRSIQNTGSSAGSCSYMIYLSTDATITSSDILVFSGSTASIAAGATDTQTDTCTAPASSGGPYYVGLLIGPTNTAASSATEVTVVDAIQAAAVGAVGAPVWVAASGTFQVSRSITNNTSTPQSVTYDIRLSTNNVISTGDFLAFNGTVTIPASSTDTQTVTVNAPAAGGPYYVGLYITTSSWLSSTGLEVWLGTNPFVATSITVVGAPVSVLQGGTFQASRSIQNGGATAASTPYVIYLSTDATIDATDTPVFSGTTASIAAGATDTQTDTCTVPAGATPGAYYVGLYIGAGVTAATAGTDVTVLLPFTPVAQAISVPSAPVTITAVGGTFDVSRQIDNAGGVAGTASYEVYLSTDATWDAADILVFSGTTASIAGSGSDIQTDTCTVAAATAPGSYYAILYIASAPSETATAATDVTVNDFSAQATAISVLNTPVRVRAGGTFDVSRSITNSGTAAGTVNYEIYLSTDTTITAADTLAFTGTTASIAGGATDTLSVTVTIPTTVAFDADYYVGLSLSAANTIASTDTVHVLPNLARFSAISVVEGAAAANVGDGLSIQVDIANTGGIDGTVDYSIYISADTTIDPTDLQILTQSTNITTDSSDSSPVLVTVPTTLGAGTYYIGVYLTSPNIQTQTAVSGAISVTVPEKDDGGSCGGGPGGGSLFAFLPLFLLAALCVGLRRRRLALEN